MAGNSAISPLPAVSSRATGSGLRFERNAGQFPEGCEFGVRTGPQAVAFSRGGIDFGQSDGSAGVRMRWLGGAADPEIVAEECVPGVANYLYGNDPSAWQTNVELFGRIRYREVYPGIDLVFYDRDGQLEYDFIVEPGSNPDLIAVTFDGADSVQLTDAGDLAIAKDDSVISHRAPLVYQDVAGGRRAIDARFEVSADGIVGFEVTEFDPTEVLVIDPGIVFSTMLGGGLGDSAGAVATDGSGSVYVTGWTSSFSFPVKNPISPYNPGGRPDGTFSGDCFVTKFTPDGSDLVYSTYIGGSLFDEGTAIAVGPDGAVYVAGTTWSSDFPTIHPVRTNHDVIDNPYSDATKDPFVFKISADGTDLVYSTYLGGTWFDEAHAIVVDEAGAAIVAGTTESPDLLTTSNAFQPTDPNVSSPSGNARDGFISKVDPNGTQLAFSTYVGGTNFYSTLLGMALAPNGDILVTGHTYESQFLEGVPQTVSGPRGYGDVFVAEFSGGLGSARWVTILGGALLDEGRDVAVDAEGSVFVAGMTTSADFPTIRAMQSNTDADYREDAFLTKLTNDGTDIYYSTYLGGTDGDAANALVVNEDGSVIVAGETRSLDFPVVLANYPFAYHTSTYTDGFVAKVSSSGLVLQQSTYLGGNEWDSILDLALVPGGDVVAAGYSLGTDFPVLNAFLADSYDGSNADAFVTRLRFSPLGPSPVITKAKGRREMPGRPSRGKITGSGFKTGAVVYAGNAGYAVRLHKTQVKANGTVIVVTEDGYDHFELFSGNGDHLVIVTNPDGGQAVLNYRK